MRVITTTPDLLIDLVDKEKKIPLSEAAKRLNVSNEQITAWVDILSKNGTIGIYYPLTGDGILIKGSGTPIKKGISGDKEREAKRTSDDLILLMKEHNFLKLDVAARKLGVELDTLKQWVEALEKEEIIDSETYFFGDIGLMKGKKFVIKLVESEAAKKTERKERK